MENIIDNLRNNSAINIVKDTLQKCVKVIYRKTL